MAGMVWAGGMRRLRHGALAAAAALAGALPGCVNLAAPQGPAAQAPLASAPDAVPAAVPPVEGKAPQMASPPAAGTTGNPPALAGTAALAAPTQGPAAAGHPHAQEIADIRRHHLSRLNERLNTPPQQLVDNCRFESDIATRPPGRRVALTFDDGPEPGQTEHILAVLEKYNITAAFFMIGEKMQRHPDLVERVRAAHHQVIGNHSWNHPNFHEISAADQAAEVLREEPLLAPGSAGEQKLFRYPFGNASCETNALVRSRGYKIVGWHIDSCDWAFEKTGAIDFQEATSCGVLPQFHADYVGHVVSAVRARNGGIILMHEIHPNTVARLEEIIVQIQSDGFAFGSVLDADFEPSLR
jgi:peptidoglycan/xylan/chitin deacetylase (PgdA/CDA1 family)